MSECTFVASPFKPSHCKLCFQAKVDHKIPVLKPVTTTAKPAEKSSNAPPTTKPPEPKTVATNVVHTPSSVPNSADEVESVRIDKNELLKKFQQEAKPVETKTEPKPAKVYKYQTNPQPPKTEETKPAETKPVKTYKYQTNPQPAYNPGSVSTSSDNNQVGENGESAERPSEEIQPKKTFKPVGGVKMQGFDPSILVKAAAERRAKKNLDSGELEETQGAQAVVEPEPEAQWEPTPSPEAGNYKRGPGADVLGGGLAALLQKRKQKEEAAEALANPNAVASVEEVEETVVLPSTPTMNKILQKIESEPTEVQAEIPPEIPESTYTPSPSVEPQNNDDDEQDWS